MDVFFVPENIIIDTKQTSELVHKNVREAFGKPEIKGVVCIMQRSGVMVSLKGAGYDDFIVFISKKFTTLLHTSSRIARQHADINSGFNKHVITSFSYAFV